MGGKFFCSSFNVDLAFDGMSVENKCEKRILE